MKYKLLLIFMLCLLIFAGCAEKTELQWTSEAANGATLLTTEHEGVTYRFDAANWGEETATAVATDITKFFSAFGAPERGVSIYFGSKGGSATDIKITGKAPSFAEYQKLFSAAYGEPKDPAMAYGAVAAVCMEKQLCEVENAYTDAELAEYFSNEKNIYLLDLTLPMIEDKFVDANSAEHARAAAISLAAYCLREHDAEELREHAFLEVNTPKKTQLKKDWINDIEAGAAYKPLALLAYKLNDKTHETRYPYVLESNSFNMLFDMQDVASQGYAEFISSYLQLAQIMEQDFAEARVAVRELMPIETPQKVVIKTNFSRKAGDDIAAALYSPLSQEIKIFESWDASAYYVLHEYIRGLTHGTAIDNSCLKEGIIEEIAIYRCTNRMRQYSMFFDADHFYFAIATNTIDEKTGEIDLPTYYVQLAANQFEAKRAEGNAELGAIKLQELPYSVLLSMVQYLYAQYEMNVVWEHSVSLQQLEEFCGMSLAELYKDSEEMVMTQLEEYKTSGY